MFRLLSRFPALSANVLNFPSLRTLWRRPPRVRGCFVPRRPPPALASMCALALLLACVVPASGADREECERQYKPELGQPGKDVMWVPTDDALVARMLKMAEVTSADLVYDLGAGDGKIAIAAARDFGAQAVGVEYE